MHLTKCSCLYSRLLHQSHGCNEILTIYCISLKHNKMSGTAKIMTSSCDLRNINNDDNNVGLCVFNQECLLGNSINQLGFSTLPLSLA